MFVIKWFDGGNIPEKPKKYYDKELIGKLPLDLYNYVYS